MEASVLWELTWYLLFIVTIYHSIKARGIIDTVVLLFPAFLWGFTLEYAAINLFARYEYVAHHLITIGQVPLYIAMGWCIVIYFGYWLATKKFHLQKLFKIDATAMITGLIIDLLILEPLAYFYRFWTWTPESIWFGSPVGNLLGWLIAIGLYISSYRIIKTHIKSRAKELALMVVGIPINLIILVTLLKIYKAFFGNL